MKKVNKTVQSGAAGVTDSSMTMTRREGKATKR